MILSIDSSGNTASVAVTTPTKLVAEITINNKKTHSQTLMPMLEYILAISDLTLDDIEYIACAEGPGSFTGLRIGASTAKGLAHGTNKKIIPVPTLDALAYNIQMPNLGAIICPCMDARRNQVYSSIYQYDENANLKRQAEYMALDFSELLELVKMKEKKAIFVGDAVSLHKKEIEENGFTVFEQIQQRAACVGFLAHSLVKEGKFLSNSEFTPFYLRMSQAEREQAAAE